MKHTSKWALALSLGIASVAVSTTASAGPPGMPDPRAMSGIARVDPALAPGEVTVRCLLGSFAEPAIGVEVQLEVQGPDGTVQRFSATSAEAGRATFTGLQGMIGSVGVATATIDGTQVRSGPIPISGQGGSRLLLVKGAAEPGPGAPAMGTPPPGSPPGATAGGPHGQAPAGPHGQAQNANDLPPFGLAFDLQGRPAGVVVIGVLDMKADAASPAEKIKPFANHPVQLFAVKKDGSRRLLAERNTDPEGRANFTDISHAADELVVAETRLETEPEPLVSAPFDTSKGGKAVVLLPPALAEELNRQQQQAQAQGQAQARPPGPAPRRPMPPVRRDADVPTDSVRVLIVDKDDRPVAGAKVQVVRLDAARDERRFDGETDASGSVTIDVTEKKKDALYFVEAIYDDAPYRSHLFDLPLTGGAAAALRVFERTEDPSVVRSAVHFELNSLENDKARILVAYEVMVDGDKAYWPRGGMQLWGPRGASTGRPLPEAEDYLEEVEGAPYAKLSGPIPPGEPVKLSMGFIAPHDGSVDVTWDAPFPLIAARVAVEGDQKVTEGAVPGPGEKVEHGGDEPIVLHELPVGEAAQPLCAQLRADDPDLHCPAVLAQSSMHELSFSVDGFTRRPPYVRWIALGVAGLIALAAALAMLLRPRRSRADLLRRRRDLLLARVEQSPQSSPERERLLAALDRIYRQLDAIGALEPDAVSRARTSS